MQEQAVETRKQQEAMVRRGCSRTVIDHWFHPENVGRTPGADACENEAFPHGDSMWIWVRVEGGRIAEASYLCNLSVETVALGSVLTRRVRGMTTEQARRMTGADLLREAGCLSPTLKRCAFLAVHTLRKALDACESSEAAAVSHVQSGR